MATKTWALGGYHLRVAARGSMRVRMRPPAIRCLWQTARMDEHAPAHLDTGEEPRWRARARWTAISCLALGLALDLACETPRPARLLGSIGVVLAVALRTPLGVAALVVDVALELLDALGAGTRGASLAGCAHAGSALGLAALSLVLYRRSEDERFERRTTLLGLAALVASGLLASLAHGS